MAKPERARRVDRSTAFTCLSVPERTVRGEHKDEIIAAFKKRGWGVLAEENRYRFIHFDENMATDLSSILDGLACDQAGWSTYRLSFPTVKATKEIVDSAEWK